MTRTPADVKSALPAEMPYACFLDRSPASHAAYSAALHGARKVLIERYAASPSSYRGTSPPELRGRFAALDPCPEQGEPLEEVLRWVGEQILPDLVAVSHPMTMAHLHCAPLIPALAAEALISATNASMDSWDQAPAASYFEQRMVEWLRDFYGMPAAGDGVFTSGGTQSNFLALLLARDACCAREFGVSVQARGLPPQAGRLRILCSEVAHFSVLQSAAILGLGHEAVIPVAVDNAQRMDVTALSARLAEARARGLLPMAIVATAGTTDFGSIDPLRETGAIARDAGIWLHVDAAYGGALAFSAKLRHLLAGIELASSVTVDFHKLFWQPISASVLLIADAANWDCLRLHADYLNPEHPRADAPLDLVAKSIQTTRRFDSLKVYISLRSLGRRSFAALVERTVEIAAFAAQRIRESSDFELICPPSINSVVFRCVNPQWPGGMTDAVNTLVRERLLAAGRALIGRTRVRGAACLKFTLLNPGVEASQIEQLLGDIRVEAVKAAAQIAQEPALKAI